MLILSRRVGESLVIGSDVVVTVLEVRGDQIRVGIDAPREVQVHREEVFRALEAQNAQATTSSPRARQLVARMPRAAAPRDRSTTAEAAPARGGEVDGDDRRFPRS